MSRKSRVFIPEKQLQCCGKNVYRSEREAKAVADDQMLLKYGLLLSTYRCLCGCHGWHLTRVKRET